MKAKLITYGKSCSFVGYKAFLTEIPYQVSCAGPTAKMAWEGLADMAHVELEPADSETEILLGLWDAR